MINEAKALLRQYLPHWVIHILFNFKVSVTKSKKFNIEVNRKQEEWFSYKEFYDYVLDKHDFINFVEVGVWKGHGVAYLAKSLKERGIGEAKVIAVDLFDDVTHYTGTLYEQDARNLTEMFDRNMKSAGVHKMVRKIKGNSWDVAKKVKDNSVDLVFIDAEHTYDSVTKDIKAYLPKVKKGGIISGHDALQKQVISAVYDFFGKAETKVMTRADTWYIEL
jgi:predicted O-methyltransferase YrrM